MGDIKRTAQPTEAEISAAIQHYKTLMTQKLERAKLWAKRHSEEGELPDFQALEVEEEVVRFAERALERKPEWAEADLDLFERWLAAGYTAEVASQDAWLVERLLKICDERRPGGKWELNETLGDIVTAEEFFTLLAESKRIRSDLD
jgi:hypothetical protein